MGGREGRERENRRRKKGEGEVRRRMGGGGRKKSCTHLPETPSQYNATCIF